MGDRPARGWPAFSGSPEILGSYGTSGMSEQDKADIRLEYARLKLEHSDLDAAINAMIATGCDTLQIQRLKKKKLQLKDRLQAVEDRIIPDIIA
jgi:hypothetical protein